jgi:hypothetical protein
MGNFWLSHPDGESVDKRRNMGCHETRTYQSALMPEAIAHFAEEAAEKVGTNQTCIVEWDNINSLSAKSVLVGENS